MLVVDGVEMLDVREAAELAHRTPETVRRWVWSGRITARKAGNRLLLAKTEVLAAIETSAPHADRSALTLRAWTDLAAAQSSRGRRGAPARDLVLDDRAARSDSDARR